METFLSVCEELNYTRAAQKLGLTQPAGLTDTPFFLEQCYITRHCSLGRRPGKNYI